jgi:hypothetical protein
MSWIAAGSVAVDSGQVLLIDPCYIPNDFDNNQGNWDPGAHANELNYQGVSHVSITNTYGEIGGGLVTSSGYGDGRYPVFVKLDEDNRVIALKVSFA